MSHRILLLVQTRKFLIQIREQIGMNWQMVNRVWQLTLVHLQFSWIFKSCSILTLTKIDFRCFEQLFDTIMLSIDLEKQTRTAKSVNKWKRQETMFSSVLQTKPIRYVWRPRSKIAFQLIRAWRETQSSERFLCRFISLLFGIELQRGEKVFIQK